MTLTMIPFRPLDQSPFCLNRRGFLGHYAGAIGTLALARLLEHDTARGADLNPGPAPPGHPEICCRLPDRPPPR